MVTVKERVKCVYDEKSGETSTMEERLKHVYDEGVGETFLQ